MHFQAANTGTPSPFFGCIPAFNRLFVSLGGESLSDDNSLCLQAKFKAMCTVIQVGVALDQCDTAIVDSATVLQDLQSCGLVRTPPFWPVCISTGKAYL